MGINFVTFSQDYKRLAVGESCCPSVHTQQAKHGDQERQKAFVFTRQIHLLYCPEAAKIAMFPS